jgi:hypothetical protein
MQFAPAQEQHDRQERHADYEGSEDARSRRHCELLHGLLVILVKKQGLIRRRILPITAASLSSPFSRFSRYRLMICMECATPTARISGMRMTDIIVMCHPTAAISPYANTTATPLTPNGNKVITALWNSPKAMMTE